MSDSNEGRNELTTTLTTHEEEILKLSDDIDATLEEHVMNHNWPTRSTILTALHMVFSTELDKETTEYLTPEFLNLILHFREDHIRDLKKETNLSGEFIRFLNRLVSKYQIDILRIHLAERQGDRFWEEITTELTLRLPAEWPGMNHTIGFPGGETVDISVSLDSNLELINHLLEKQIEAHNSFENKAGLSMGRLERTKELADTLVNEINEVGQE